jgi:hypothetical protein
MWMSKLQKGRFVMLDSRNKRACVYLKICVFFVFSVMFVQPVSAITIKKSMGVELIQAGIQEEIDTLPDIGGTVAVLGLLNNAASTLSLRIPALVTVEWGARYEGSVPGGAPLVSVSGAGKFFMRDNSLLANSSRFGSTLAVADNVLVIISQGSVTADGFAIKTEGDIIVDEGAMISAGTRGIMSGKGLVTVYGGTIMATGENGVAIDSSGGNVTIQNGMVYARAKNASAITYSKGIVTIEGNAIVYTMRNIAPEMLNFKSGMLFSSDQGVVYGNFLVKRDITIDSGQTLKLHKGAMLIVPKGMTVTIKSNSTVNNDDGIISNEGTIKNGGTITNQLNWNGIPFEDTRGKNEGIFSWF